MCSSGAALSRLVRNPLAKCKRVNTGLRNVSQLKSGKKGSCPSCWKCDAFQRTFAEPLYLWKHLDPLRMQFINCPKKTLHPIKLVSERYPVANHVQMSTWKDQYGRLRQSFVKCSENKHPLPHSLTKTTKLASPSKQPKGAASLFNFNTTLILDNSLLMM